MEIKLKSTLNRIPWWLACKAGVIGFSWLLFPFWLFFLVANYFYWVPVFEAGAFLVPFLLTLLLAAIGESGWFAFGIGALFFFILGAKELMFIRRVRIYEVLSVALLFLGVLVLTDITQGKQQLELSFAYLLAGLAFFFLRESAFRYIASHREEEAFFIPSGTQRFLESALSAVLFWEYGSIVGGLPLETIPKSAALFSGAVAFFLLTPFERGKISLQELGRYFGVLLAAIIIIFITSSWAL